MSEQQKGVEAAISAAGSQAALADALGVSQQAVSRWRSQGFAPLRRAQEIEALYGVPRAGLINPRITDLVDAAGDL